MGFNPRTGCATKMLNSQSNVTIRLHQNFLDRPSRHFACSRAENGGAGGGDIDMMDGAIALSRLNSSAQGQQPDISAGRIAAAVIQESV